MSTFIEGPQRFGGPQNEEEEMEAQRKHEERERKKAEVRKRLEEAGNKKNAKKGFLTPERKKKLRKLLMIKAAEDLKQQQLLKAEERKRVLAQRTIALPDLESVDEKSKLESIYEEMFQRIVSLETEKYDVNQAVLSQDKMINELSIAVNDLRGKFVKPALKKVSKIDNRFKKMTTSVPGEKQDFRANLKMVQKESALEKLDKKKSDKPEWSKKGEKSSAPAVVGNEPEPEEVEEDEELPVADEEPMEDEDEYEEENEEEEEE